jgi:hypothetical protein
MSLCAFYMLHISGKSSYYTTKVANKGGIERGEILPPVPKLYNSVMMPFDQWYNKYEKDITTMTCNVVENIFNLSSEKYIANFNINAIKKELAELFYKTSHNKYRNYLG